MTKQQFKMRDLIRIVFEDGSQLALFQLRDWKVIKSGPQASEAKFVANQMQDEYQYGSGDGEPGYAIASQIAEEVGGVVKLPELPEMQKNLVY